MIEIDLNSFQGGNGYTCSLLGNGGENQIIVAFSPSQALKGPLVILEMAVDGGAKVRATHTDKKGWVSHEKLRQVLYEDLVSWASQGLKPSAQELQEIKQRAIAAAAMMGDYFGC